MPTLIARGNGLRVGVGTTLDSASAACPLRAATYYKVSAGDEHYLAHVLLGRLLLQLKTNRPEREMPTTITVMYENIDDATFDLDYYMAKHMPLVDAKFKPFGIKGWRVLKAVGTPTGKKPLYSIIANLEFDTADQFKAAVAAEGGPVFGDVPNFSNKAPVVVIGDLVGTA